MSFSYNQIVSKVEELGLDPYYDMDSLPESDRDDILDHLFLITLTLRCLRSWTALTLLV